MARHLYPFVLDEDTTTHIAAAMDIQSTVGQLQRISSSADFYSRYTKLLLHCDVCSYIVFDDKAETKSCH